MRGDQHEVESDQDIVTNNNSQVSPLKGLNHNGLSHADDTISDDLSTRPTGAFHGHNREQVTRILIQGLTDLGYSSAAKLLSRESGYELEDTSVAAFRTSILEGQWDHAEALLFGRRRTQVSPLNGNDNNTPGSRNTNQDDPSNIHVAGIPLADNANQNEMLFLIRQQKYLELLEKKEINKALHVLRKELTPLHQHTARLHTLSGFIMCSSVEQLRGMAQWDGAAGESRSHVLSALSNSIAPSVMIPEHRLATIFKEFQDVQIEECLYHNTYTQPSLYNDHVCSADDFPLQSVRDLTEHSAEVWHIAFSPSGKMLASGSADNIVYIYTTADWLPRIRIVVRSMGIVKGISCLAWSPNEQFLLVCSQSKDLTLWHVSNQARQVATIEDFDQPVTSVAWLPDGQSYIVASHDHIHSLRQYKVGEDKPMHIFTHASEALRVSDLSIPNDGSKVAAITVDKRILIFDLTLPSKAKTTEFVMDQILDSIEFTADGKSLLVGLHNGETLLVESTTGTYEQTYEGSEQADCVIRASFGGANQNFVVRGTSNSQIRIWKRYSGTQVMELDAHAPKAVNCIAWHPTNPQIFASAGDDCLVKLWAPTLSALGVNNTLKPSRGVLNGNKLPLLSSVATTSPSAEKS